jgi:mannose-6-phosphate isomerase-like protein (cupin superfamily)
MSVTNKVGAKVRQLREMREMTLDQLAEQSQCHIDLLQRIEAGELVPSLAPLMNIARALGLRLGTLLDDEPHDGPLLVKSGQSPSVTRFSGKGPNATCSNLVFQSMGAGKKDRHMEPFLIDVQPCGEEKPSVSSHEGEEFVYVLSGSIQVCYGAQVYLLEAGDSLYYDSIIPHYVCARDGAARILAVVYAPF